MARRAGRRTYPDWRHRRQCALDDRRVNRLLGCRLKEHARYRRIPRLDLGCSGVDRRTRWDGHWRTGVRPGHLLRYLWTAVACEEGSGRGRLGGALLHLNDRQHFHDRACRDDGRYLHLYLRNAAVRAAPSRLGGHNCMHVLPEYIQQCADRRRLDNLVRAVFDSDSATAVEYQRLRFLAVARLERTARDRVGREGSPYLEIPAPGPN